MRLWGCPSLVAPLMICLSILYLSLCTSDEQLFSVEGELTVQEPSKAIYQFAGRFSRGRQGASAPVGEVESLGLENTLWANTVVATGGVVGSEWSLVSVSR